MGTITNAYNKEWPLEDVLAHVGKGWHPIVTKMVADLFEAGWDGHLHQIKEKFGGLRFYTGKVTMEQSTIIRQAESAASRTCEICGEPGETITEGWHKTLCPEHAAEKLARDKERNPEWFE